MERLTPYPGWISLPELSFSLLGVRAIENYFDTLDPKRVDVDEPFHGNHGADARRFDRRVLSLAAFASHRSLWRSLLEQQRLLALESLGQ